MALAVDTLTIMEIRLQRFKEDYLRHIYWLWGSCALTRALNDSCHVMMIMYLYQIAWLLGGKIYHTGPNIRQTEWWPDQ